jgi:hypothetical protein
LKQSSLERALAKVGSYDSGEMNLEQFTKLTDIIQKETDATKLSDVYEKAQGKDSAPRKLDFDSFPSQSRVLSLPPTNINNARANNDDNNDDNDDDDDDGMVEEVSEEVATREIFNQLKPSGSATLPLVEFIRWSDVQDLLSSGALSRDDLASAIEKTGITVENGELTFETVSLLHKQTISSAHSYLLCLENMFSSFSFMILCN